MTWAHRDKPSKSWNELRDHLFEVAGSDQLACRGQAADFGRGRLLSSLDRVFETTRLVGPTAIAIERIAIQRFLQQAPNYLPPAEQQHLNDGPSLLMLMRHHGGPTRLLDWTESLWIALFNACDGCWGEDGVIWVFHRERFDAAMANKFGDETPHATQTSGLDGAPILPAVTVLQLKKWVCRLFPTGPRIPRLIAQQGSFTIGSQLGIDHAEFIDQILPNEDSPIKWRISIPKDLKARTLKELAKMGITASALYPGVDGVGKYLTSFAHFGHLDDGVTSAANSGWGLLRQAN